MSYSEFALDGRVGKIIEVDEPADLDTMFSIVHGSHHVEILRAQRDALFVLVVFGKKPKQESQQCLDLPDWYPVLPRTAMHHASDWHNHLGVVIHTPYQEEPVIPTAVSTHRCIADARISTGIHAKKSLPDREQQLKLNDAVPMFRPDSIQPSGYSLIIPEGEMHTKIVVPESYEGNGGTVHRRTW